MIVLVKEKVNVRCFDCGQPIESSHILLPHPWGTIALHIDCARDLGRKLLEEAMERYCSTIASPPITDQQYVERMEELNKYLKSSEVAGGVSIEELQRRERDAKLEANKEMTDKQKAASRRDNARQDQYHRALLEKKRKK